ncbi:CAAX prenyl protease-related protein [Candidatus Woesearchaeota archaeon]|nr:CAAX prenyl protease-related protein [Candidatus Woesearchaeota archaeon]
MYYYIIPFLVYILTIPLINYNHGLIIRVAILSLFLLAFRKFYRFRLKFDVFSVLAGIIVFLLWILLEGHYPLFGAASIYVPKNIASLFFRVFSFVIIAPIIEEFFTRNFLARILIKNDWQKVRLGAFTTTSFIFTALFFGFSHNRWLPGLIAGAILNYTIHRKKDMGSVILAHSTANILLSVYIIYTKSWFLW